MVIYIENSNLAYYRILASLISLDYHIPYGKKFRRIGTQNTFGGENISRLSISTKKIKVNQKIGG